MSTKDINKEKNDIEKELKENVKIASDLRAAIERENKKLTDLSSQLNTSKASEFGASEASEFSVNRDEKLKSQISKFLEIVKKNGGNGYVKEIEIDEGKQKLNVHSSSIKDFMDVSRAIIFNALSGLKSKAIDEWSKKLSFSFGASGDEGANYDELDVLAKVKHHKTGKYITDSNFSEKGPSGPSSGRSQVTGIKSFSGCTKEFIERYIKRLNYVFTNFVAIPSEKELGDLYGLFKKAGNEWNDSLNMDLFLSPDKIINFLTGNNKNLSSNFMKRTAPTGERKYDINYARVIIPRTVMLKVSDKMDKHEGKIYSSDGINKICLEVLNDYISHIEFLKTLFPKDKLDDNPLSSKESAEQNYAWIFDHVYENICIPVYDGETKASKTEVEYKNCFFKGKWKNVSETFFLKGKKGNTASKYYDVCEYKPINDFGQFSHRGPARIMEYFYFIMGTKSEALLKDFNGNSKGVGNPLNYWRDNCSDKDKDEIIKNGEYIGIASANDLQKVDSGKTELLGQEKQKVEESLNELKRQEEVVERKVKELTEKSKEANSGRFAEDIVSLSKTAEGIIKKKEESKSNYKLTCAECEEFLRNYNNLDGEITKNASKSIVNLVDGDIKLEARLGNLITYKTRIVDAKKVVEEAYNSANWDEGKEASFFHSELKSSIGEIELEAETTRNDDDAAKIKKVKSFVKDKVGEDTQDGQKIKGMVRDIIERIRELQAFEHIKLDKKYLEYKNFIQENNLYEESKLENIFKVTFLLSEADAEEIGERWGESPFVENPALFEQIIYNPFNICKKGGSFHKFLGSGYETVSDWIKEKEDWKEVVSKICSFHIQRFFESADLKNLDKESPEYIRIPIAWFLFLENEWEGFEWKDSKDVELSKILKKSFFPTAYGRTVSNSEEKEANFCKEVGFEDSNGFDVALIEIFNHVFSGKLKDMFSYVDKKAKEDGVSLSTYLRDKAGKFSELFNDSYNKRFEEEVGVKVADLDQAKFDSLDEEKVKAAKKVLEEKKSGVGSAYFNENDNNVMTLITKRLAKKGAEDIEQEETEEEESKEKKDQKLTENNGSKGKEEVIEGAQNTEQNTSENKSGGSVSTMNIVAASCAGLAVVGTIFYIFSRNDNDEKPGGNN